MSKPNRKAQRPYRKKQKNSYMWGIAGFLVVGLIAIWGVAEWTKPERRLPALEKFADEGQTHVADGTAITYKTDPPTSGAHYAVATRSGFYTEPQPAGNLVHALEHGRIVMYYDPTKTPSDVVDELKAYATKYTGEWDGVVVLPREQSEQVVLTAWRNMLRLSKWDRKQAEIFIDAFRGRGPENPVR